MRRHRIRKNSLIQKGGTGKTTTCVRTFPDFGLMYNYYMNHENVLMFWEVGKYIGSVLLGNERAKYGKQIVVPLAQQLSWSHFIALLPLKLMIVKSS